MSAILILSAGRRVSLVRAFRAAADERRVLAADMAPRMSAACHVADAAFMLPHCLDREYPDALEALCREQQVALVVPTIDTELAGLAALRERFAAFGCTLVVSDSDFVAACRDKVRTAAHFAALDVASPDIYPVDALRFPALSKPIDGSLSKDVEVLRSLADLQPRHRDNPRLMFARYLDHAVHEEFTCDAYYDAAHVLRCVVPRRRIEVRGGEVSKARAEKNDLLGLFADKLAHLPGARGCLTIQFMRHRDTGEAWLIECNPRFGGGYPLTAAAGAHYHRWLIEEYLEGESIASFDGWNDGRTMLRYDGEVLLDT